MRTRRRASGRTDALGNAALLARKGGMKISELISWKVRGCMISCRPRVLIFTHSALRGLCGRYVFESNFLFEFSPVECIFIFILNPSFSCSRSSLILLYTHVLMSSRLESYSYSYSSHSSLAPIHTRILFPFILESLMP